MSVILILWFVLVFTKEYQSTSVLEPTCDKRSVPTVTAEAVPLVLLGSGVLVQLPPEVKVVKVAEAEKAELPLVHTACV